MNKDLKDKIYTIPPIVLSAIKDNVNRYPDDVDGTKRAKNLLTGKVNYNQLKRVLHDMKTFVKDNEMGKYNLAGGKPFETWGWTILNNDRDVIEQNKKTSQNSDTIGGITGRKNRFNKSTKKSSISSMNISPPNALVTNSTPTKYTSDLKLGKLYEEIKRIKRLMI